jgi:hypothetical protein
VALLSDFEEQEGQEQGAYEIAIDVGFDKELEYWVGEGRHLDKFAESCSYSSLNLNAIHFVCPPDLAQRTSQGMLIKSHQKGAEKSLIRTISFKLDKSSQLVSLRISHQRFDDDYEFSLDE